jgi:hypothetical protein
MASFRFCNDSCLFSGVASQTEEPVVSSVALPFPFATYGIGPVPLHASDPSEVGLSSATFDSKWNRWINVGALAAVGLLAGLFADETDALSESVCGNALR